MNMISRTEFGRLTVDEIDALMPLVLTHNGEPRYMAAAPKDIIVIGDLHPRVRNMLRALERRARIGMPPNKDIDVQDWQIARMKQEQVG